MARAAGRVRQNACRTSRWARGGHGSSQQQAVLVVCALRQQMQEGTALMKDLSVLTPPLLMAAAVVVAVVAFLRREMGPKRPEETPEPDDIPAVPPISGQQADSQRAGTGASSEDDSR